MSTVDKLNQLFRFLNFNETEIEKAIKDLEELIAITAFEFMKITLDKAKLTDLKIKLEKQPVEKQQAILTEAMKTYFSQTEIDEFFQKAAKSVLSDYITSVSLKLSENKRQELFSLLKEKTV